MILITIGIGLSMLNIENAQLITGPVAYLLILLGCIQMKQEGQSFKKTIPYAAVMLGLQLLVVVLSVISVAAALSIDLGYGCVFSLYAGWKATDHNYCNRSYLCGCCNGS